MSSQQRRTTGQRGAPVAAPYGVPDHQQEGHHKAEEQVGQEDPDVVLNEQVPDDILLDLQASVPVGDEEGE